MRDAAHWLFYSGSLGDGGPAAPTLLVGSLRFPPQDSGNYKRANDGSYCSSDVATLYMKHIALIVSIYHTFDERQ